MNEPQFWTLIEEAGKKSDGAIEKQTEQLKSVLWEMTKKDLLEFIILFWKKMGELHTWDLLAVPHIAYLKCTNSNFEEFRAWLISRGKNSFDDALKRNIHAAELVKNYLPNQATGEGSEAFYMLPNDVYEDRFDEDPFDAMNENDYLENTPPLGTPWHLHRLTDQYPEICHLFNRQASDFLNP
jgi:hypothetical protein